MKNLLLLSLGALSLFLTTALRAQHAPERPTWPFAFVRNDGQWKDDARYVLTLEDHAVALHEDGFAFHLQAGDHTEKVRIRFPGAASPWFEEGERRPERRAYLLGDPERWRSSVPSFSRIVQREVHPGIALVLQEGEGGVFRYDLHLEPHADLEGFSMHAEGALGLVLEDDGSLSLETRSGRLLQQPPRTFEIAEDGTSQPIEARFRILGPDTYGFEAPNWSRDRRLVIDPGVTWSTYLGHTGTDACWALDEAANGDVLVVGATYSRDFPITMAAHQPLINGSADGFVARFSPDGTTLIWATFLGGTSNDFLFDVEEEANGSVVVAGATASNDFPIASFSFQSNHAGGWDGVIARLDANGSNLLYGSFFGGSGDELVFDMEQDDQGLFTVAGTTSSGDLPVTPGSFQQTLRGSQDAFVARFDLAGAGPADLLWSTYLGGTGLEGESGRPDSSLLDVDEEMDTVDCALARNGEVVVAGRTESADFPVTPTGFQRNLGGNASSDAFVTRLSADGANLVWSTYLGSAAREDFGALALDPRERPVIALECHGAGFPTTAGAFQSSFAGGSYDILLARLDAAGTTLEHATYLGGANADRVGAIHLDLSGTLTLVGSTDSADFPTTRGADDTSLNVTATSDIVVVRFRLDGRGARDLQYSSFLGRRGSEHATDLLWNERFELTLVGFTNGNNFPTNSNSYSQTYWGNFEGIVARFFVAPTGVTHYGRDTTGCPTPIAADVNSQPHLGNADFALVCRGGVGGASTLFFVSMGLRLVPLNIAGIDLFLDPGSLFLTLDLPADPDGYVEVDLPIPNWSGALGRTIYAQFVWPGVCLPPLLASSNPIQVTTQM